MTNLSEYITEQFGANASYVEGLLTRYRNDPSSVDESWRSYFIEIMNGASPLERGLGGASAPAESGANLTAANGAQTSAAAAPATISATIIAAVSATTNQVWRSLRA